MRSNPPRKTLFPIVSILLFLCIFGLPADDARLGSLEIEGLKRTKEHVVRDLIGLEAGDAVSDESIAELTIRLQKSDIFANVAVRKREGTSPGFIDLVVTIDEKWTLIPIPFFSTDGSDFSGGLFLLESNLFGMNKFLMTAAFGGTDGLNGLVIYSDPSVAGSRWSASTVGSFGRSEERSELANGTLIRSYTTDYQQISLGLGYAISPVLELSGRIAYRMWQVDQYTSSFDPDPLDDGFYVEPRLTLSYDDTVPVGALLMGLTAEASGRYVSLDHGLEASGSAEWALPVLSSHRLRVLVNAGYGKMHPVAQRQISAQDGFRTLPYQAADADSWASTSVLYDLPVLTMNWGTVVLSHFWEAGIFDSDASKPQLFYGFGGGLRVYLRQVAIPAMGVDIAYNIADPSWVFSFTIGMEM